MTKRATIGQWAGQCPVAGQGRQGSAGHWWERESARRKKSEQILYRSGVTAAHWPVVVPSPRQFSFGTTLPYNRSLALSLCLLHLLRPRRTSTAHLSVRGAAPAPRPFRFVLRFVSFHFALHSFSFALPSLSLPSFASSPHLLPHSPQP